MSLVSCALTFGQAALLDLLGPLLTLLVELGPRHSDGGAIRLTDGDEALTLWPAGVLTGRGAQGGRSLVSQGLRGRLPELLRRQSATGGVGGLLSWGRRGCRLIWRRRLVDRGSILALLPAAEGSTQGVEVDC